MRLARDFKPAKDLVAICFDSLSQAIRRSEATRLGKGMEQVDPNWGIESPDRDFQNPIEELDTPIAILEKRSGI